MKQKTLHLRYIILASLFAGLMAISAWFKIPLPPTMTPVTLQVLFVLFAGLLLPPAYAFASQAVYVLLGLIGLPVFTEGGGFAYLLKTHLWVFTRFYSGRLADRPFGKSRFVKTTDFSFPYRAF